MGGAEQARIAQVVEHSLGKGEVTGSSPVVGTIIGYIRNFGKNSAAFLGVTAYFGDRHVKSKI
jgi:hypothetical protein